MRISNCESRPKPDHAMRSDYGVRAKVMSKQFSNQFSSHIIIDLKSALRNLKSAILLSASLFALCSSAEAQQTAKAHKIGILFIGGRDQPHLETFKQGLRDLGYVEGKNIVFEYRYAEGNTERLAQLAADLVQHNVEVIVATASSSARAVRQATKTIPIVMTTGDPLAMDLATSLARPGGNVTGLTVMLADLSGKRLELLKESLPKMTRIAALYSPRERESATGYQETKAAAQAFPLRLHAVKVQSAADYDQAFVEMAKARASALLVILSPLATLNSQRIVQLARKHHLPGMYPTRQFAEEGGLMSYGPLIGDLYRRAATYVDKILKGAKPADLPIEQPMKFEFFVNLKTAKQLGVTIPPNVLARADKVIR
jgi:putative ABC transport system substrate-binding protein